jgi:hypothetical protein
MADRLLAARLAELRAQADQTVLLAELAEQYILPRGAEETHGALVSDALIEEVHPFGGPGAPLISEYAAPEVAALLGISRRKATILIEGAVHLKWQLPGLYERMSRLLVEADRAVQASYSVSGLPPELARIVIERWLPIQERYSWTGAFNKLSELIAEVDPHRAEEEAQALQQRQVTVTTGKGNLGDAAVGYIEATVDVVDAKLFDAALTQIAGLLQSVHGDDSPMAIRRAKAFGVLSRPAYALALIQRGAQAESDPSPSLPIEQEADDRQPRHGDSDRLLPGSCTGHTCGTITIPIEKLLPKVGIEVVIDADAVGADAVARIDEATVIATTTLAELLGGKSVQLRPVIDLPRVPSEHQYRPSLAMRRAVLRRWRHEAFPFSHRRTGGLDLDHVQPYRSDGTPGQTSQRNLIPLGRGNHRAKTARLWMVRIDDLGRAIWESPLGYRYVVTPYGTEPVLPLRLYGRDRQRSA